MTQCKPALLCVSVLFFISCKPSRNEPIFHLEQLDFPYLQVANHAQSDSFIHTYMRLCLIEDSAKDVSMLKIRRTEDSIFLEPSIRLQAGSTYLLKWKQDGIKRLKILEIPGSDQGKNAIVGVYPQNEKIPANILQFHLVFSQAVDADESAYQFLIVKDENGKVLPKMWREKAEWNHDRTILSVMVHPGRIKRGIEYMGVDKTLFKEGNTYSLYLDEGIYHTQMKGSELLLKRFTLTSSDHNSPELKHSNYDSCLHFSFNEVMDYGTLYYGVQAYLAGKKYVVKTTESINGMDWELDFNVEQKPDSICLESIIADLSANQIGRLFEEKNMKAFRNEGRGIIIYP